MIGATLTASELSYFGLSLYKGYSYDQCLFAISRKISAKKTGIAFLAEHRPRRVNYSLLINAIVYLKLETGSDSLHIIYLYLIALSQKQKAIVITRLQISAVLLLVMKQRTS